MSSNNQTAPATDGLVPLARPPLLMTKSADELAALLSALRQEIKPDGIIENIYLEDLAAIVWEILRFRRYKVDPYLSTMPALPPCGEFWNNCFAAKISKTTTETADDLAATGLIPKDEQKYQFHRFR